MYYLEYNHNNNSHKYRCDGVCDDPEVIAYFMNGFIDSDDTMDQYNTTIMLMKASKVSFQSVTKTLYLATPPSKEVNEAGSHHVLKAKVVESPLSKEIQPQESDHGVKTLDFATPQSKFFFAVECGNGSSNGKKCETSCDWRIFPVLNGFVVI